MDEFKESIKAHFLKSVDIVGVDLRSFNANQKKEIMDYIKTNFKDKLSKTILIDKPNG